MAVRRTKEPRPPTGLTRVLFRLPIGLYRLGLGWLLGRHHLLLEHTGRKSGLRRRAIAVRLSKDEAAREYLEFARRSPRVARFGVKLLGYTVDGIEDFAELGAMMPMVAFRYEV